MRETKDYRLRSAAIVLATAMLLSASLVTTNTRSAYATDIEHGELDNAGWKLDIDNISWGWYQSAHDGIEFLQANFKGSTEGKEMVATDGTMSFLITTYPDGETITDHFCEDDDDSTPDPPPSSSQAWCNQRVDGINQNNQASSSTLSAKYTSVGYIWDQTVRYVNDGKMENEVRFWGPGIQHVFAQYPYITFYWRYDLDVKFYDENEFYRCESGSWSKKTVEGAYSTSGNYGTYCNDYEWKVKDETTSMEVRFKPLDQGDDDSTNGARAVAYVANYNINEWDGGEMGGLDETQLPSDFVSPAESISDGDIVIWYKVRTPTITTACMSNPPSGGADCKSAFMSRAFNYP